MMSNRRSGTNTNNRLRRRQRVPRPRVQFDGQLVSGSGLPPASSVSTAATLGTSLMFFDCSTASNSASQRLSGLTKLYNEFIYESAVIEWIPSVGPNSADASSRMAVAFFYNPEIMQYMINNLAVPANFQPRVEGSQNVKFFSAWERVRFNVPFINRRKMFDVNSTEDQTNVDVNDRSVQAIVATSANSVSAVVNLGSWHVTYKLRLRGLYADVAT